MRETIIEPCNNCGKMVTKYKAFVESRRRWGNKVEFFCNLACYRTYRRSHRNAGGWL